MFGKTNKTEYQRFLNDYPSSDPALVRLLQVYLANPHGKQIFGFWLRTKHPARFNSSYTRWWLKRPELHGSIYFQSP
jgi:hypothetical protein